MVHYTMLGIAPAFLGTLTYHFGMKMVKLISDSGSAGAKSDQNEALVKRMTKFVLFVREQAFSNTLLAFAMAFWPWLRNHAPYQLAFAWSAGLVVFVAASLQFKV